MLIDRRNAVLKFVTEIAFKPLKQLDTRPDRRVLIRLHLDLRTTTLPKRLSMVSTTDRLSAHPDTPVDC